MKIKEGKYSFKYSLKKEPQEFTIKEAIVDAATHRAYSYEGQLEKLAEENRLLRDIVARLIASLYSDVANSQHERLQYILGYGYEVEE